MARLHQNNFATNVTSNQIAGVTTTPLNSIPSIAAPFYIALDATNINGHYEVVDATSKTATNINHAATSYAHSTDEEVRMVVPAVELDAFSAGSSTTANGWTSVSDTWSYASASTITVPSGAASLYQKGDKIKLTQTTVKYFYIIGVADTVLTITGGTSYTLVSAAISDISVSHQNTPVGFPQSMNYTPTITSGGGTPTTVTATCKFSIAGDQCKIYEVVTMTNAGTASGEVLSTLPVSFSDDRSPLSAWEGASTGFSCVAHGLLSDLTKIGVSKYDFTTIWATGRVLFISGNYSF